MRIAGQVSVSGAVESLGPSSLGRLFQNALPAYHSAGGRISVLERAASRRLLVEAGHLGRREPLGAGLAVGYLWAKVSEVENLRLICRAVHTGMPRQVLEEEITLPPT
jgi:vacuolar-type H+-ATPase subunit C/Vma6